MQYLRGTENLFVDLASGSADVFKLRDMIHEFYLREVEMWADTDVDGIHIEDDWGTQLSLLISPGMWREYFKPLYKDYCGIAHRKGKFVVMHSDGQISDILPDLIEIGVNAVNVQLDCMDVERLASLYHGRLAFWGGFDRQYLLPFGSEAEVRNEVRRIGGAFFRYGYTGVVGQCFRDKGAKEENIRAVYDEWSRC
ncbi:MAG: methyltransferase, partial [Defluviitaleaceae bacterium]|nr:methyltransferase [Defluviitaleaceae bacterium]